MIFSVHLGVPGIGAEALDRPVFDLARRKDQVHGWVPDTRCDAITFNTHYNFCFLKSDSRILVRNPDAYSEISAALAPDVYVPSMTVLPDMDSPGGDYARITLTDFVQCLLECGADRQCSGFSFVRRTGECWLKDRISEPVSMPGVEFGAMLYR